MPLSRVVLSFISHSILEAGREPRNGLVQDFSTQDYWHFGQEKSLFWETVLYIVECLIAFWPLPIRCQMHLWLWQPIMFRAMSPQLRTTWLTQSPHFMEEAPDSQMQRVELINHTSTITNQISELFQQNQAALVFFWFTYMSKWIRSSDPAWKGILNSELKLAWPYNILQKASSPIKRNSCEPNISQNWISQRLKKKKHLYFSKHTKCNEYHIRLVLFEQVEYVKPLNTMR